jgi:glycosyltransferase involved in cell wall biosynthesis
LTNLIHLKADKKLDQIIFLCRSPIDSGLANIVQSVQMASALSISLPVILNGCAISIQASERRIEDILGFKPNFDLVLSRSFFSTRVLLVIVHLFFKPKDSKLLVTRSALVALVLLMSRQRVLLEFHSDTLSSKIYIQKILSLIYKTSMAEKIIKISISDALSRRLKTKFRISTDLVLHDAWNNKKYLKTRRDYNKDSKFLVVYTGKITLDRGIDQIFQLAEKDKDSIFMILGGSKSESRELKKIVKIKNIKNVKVYSYQRSSRIKYLQERADMLIAFWSEKVPTIEYCSPLKLFEYMGTGNKVLIHDFPVFQEVLIKSPLIELCKPGDHLSEYNAYKRLKKRAITPEDAENLRFYSEEFSYTNRAKLLLEHVSGITNSI